MAKKKGLEKVQATIPHLLSKNILDQKQVDQILELIKLIKK